MSDLNGKAGDPQAGPPPEPAAEPVSPDSAVRMMREMSQQGGVQETLINEAPVLIGRTLGQYRIITKIGQGGMGAVFKAEDTALKREVAVKVLWTGPLDDARIAERFMREARCLARLSHPNLLHVYNVGTEGSLKYFAMELLKGETLSAALQRGPLNLPDALNITGQMLSALDYVHHQGITHRDIKSGNIMLCGSRTVLMDFGLAKEEHQTGLTSEGVVMGTPEYMTPEQADGRACGAPTDIYSLGIVMYEMLTGEVPFVGRSALSIIRQHLEEPPPSLQRRLPGVDARLDQVITRSLAKSPQDRFPDCAAMADALVRIHRTPELLQLASSRTAGETLIAAPGDLPQPTVRFPTESPNPPARRWLWTVAGFLVVLVLGGLVLRGMRRQPTPSRGQVVRVQSGPNQGQTLRWEFVSQNTDPKMWMHRVETLNPDGTWSAPSMMKHDDFIKAYPQLVPGNNSVQEEHEP